MSVCFYQRLQNKKKPQQVEGEKEMDGDDVEDEESLCKLIREVREMREYMIKKIHKTNSTKRIEDWGGMNRRDGWMEKIWNTRVCTVCCLCHQLQIFCCLHSKGTKFVKSGSGHLGW